MLPARDSELVQIVDAALADATARAIKSDGTSWLTCHAGCTPCCHGVFKISLLDAERLRMALQQMDIDGAERAHAIRERAKNLVSILKSQFSGDCETGLLGPDEDAWDTFANLPEADAPCPALDPGTGRCELYSGRPLTCRIFGPPLRGQTGIGLCELNYVGATEKEILDGQMFLTHGTLEEELDREFPPGETVIAWVLANSPLQIEPQASHQTADRSTLRAVVSTRS